MSRAIIKVGVSDLDEIPWFFVFSEGTDFESDSWTVQCEVLHIHMLGSAAQDEDLPLGDDDFDPNNFFYYGFGQFGQGPPPPPNDSPAPFILEHLQAMGWGVWPNQAVEDIGGNLHQQPNALGNQQPNVDGPPMLTPIQPGQEPMVPNNNVEVVPPPVEEVIQAPVAELDEVPPPLMEGQVLEMDDNTDASEDKFHMPPPPALVVSVDIPNFPNLQNISHIQVEEVPLEDHIAFDDLEPQNGLIPQNDQVEQLVINQNDLNNVQLQAYPPLVVQNEVQPQDNF
jgi:hypothetical protein